MHNKIQQWFLEKYLKSVFHLRITWFLLAVAMTAFPVLALYYDIIPKSDRIGVIFAMLAVALAFTCFQIYYMKRWTWRSLGFRSDNFRKGIPMYSKLFLVCLGVFILALILFPIERKEVPMEKRWMVLGVIPFMLSFIQEFLFRCVLLRILEHACRTKWGIVIWSACLFMALHAFYPYHRGLILPLTFLMGGAFTWVYMRHPNWVLASLVHWPLNVIAIFVSLFFFGPG